MALKEENLKLKEEISELKKKKLETGGGNQCVKNK
jgi:hypothetical protein